jgi:hypothetical protein
LDHAASASRPTTNGSTATSVAVGSPGAHVKNLGPGRVDVRADGVAAALNAPQCYPLDAGEEWDFWFVGDSGTLSLFGPSGTVLSVIPYKAVTLG